MLPENSGRARVISLLEQAAIASDSLQLGRILPKLGMSTKPWGTKLHPQSDRIGRMWIGRVSCAQMIPWRLERTAVVRFFDRRDSNGRLWMSRLPYSAFMFSSLSVQYAVGRCLSTMGSPFARVTGGTLAASSHGKH